MSEPEVLIGSVGRAGRLTLNRPKALHALTFDMCQAMTEALLAWRDDPGVETVIIDHAGERGFCAGGDIRPLAESGAGDGAAARAFFFVEYRLNHLLFTYPKPVTAFMDGVTMGGGVGLAMPSRHRIATERTQVAMPETGIGLFPDVGGGWHLPRLPGRAGLWMALTGARIGPAHCLTLGVATHYVTSDRLDEAKAAIGADPDKVGAVLAAAASDPGPAPVALDRDAMDHLFRGGGVEAIIADLQADPGDWAKAQLAALRLKSPQALKVAFRQLSLGAHARSFPENMTMEYRISARVVRRPDFLEGVRAVIVEKDNQPKWNPSTLAAVTTETLDEIFAPLPSDQEWSPLPQAGR